MPRNTLNIYTLRDADAVLPCRDFTGDPRNLLEDQNVGTAQSRSQSAAERKAAEAEARGLITKHATEHAKLVGSLRKAVRKRLPTARELVYEYRSWIVISYSPNENGYDGVLALRADADGVKFYFNRGKELPDPEKRLKGSGGLVRFIELESAVTLKSPAVVKFIEEAIERSAVPFADGGKGSVIIRSATSKQKAAKTAAKASKASGGGKPKSIRVRKKPSRT